VSGPRVGIVMGSDSDKSVMEAATKILDEFGVEWEMQTASAHRMPEKAMKYARSAEERGLQVIIAGAGWSAHLAGCMAAHSILPVIGVPIESSPLNGLDSLLSTVNMPGGVPVATVSLGRSGAKNAAVLATQILARSDAELAEKLHEYKARLAGG